MRKILIFFSFIVFASTLMLTSCSEDEGDLKKTGEIGKPSALTSNDETKYFYYQGSKLSRIKDISNSGVSRNTKFSYKDGVLSSVYSSFDDSNIMDGDNLIIFERIDPKTILVTESAEPFFNIVFKMELDDKEKPLKLTCFKRNFNHELGEDPSFELVLGDYYADFEFASNSMNLIGMSIYDINTDKAISIFEYEYDNNIGTFSKVNLPIWYYAYKAFMSRGYYGEFSTASLNYTNNITKITKTGLSGFTITYNYEYDEDGMPVSMVSDRENSTVVSIKY